MSVICQNFVQNAWKKDLCSNCFKSVGDHESVGIVEDSEYSSSNGNDHRNGKSISQAPTVNTTSNETPPHTTWRSLISEKNGINSQPFKLENGFQGRLLTINKALNGSDKQHYSEANVRNKTNSQSVINGASVKTANGILKKQPLKSESTQGKQNGSNVRNENSLCNGESSGQKLKDTEGTGHSTVFNKKKNINGHLAESSNSVNGKVSDKKPKFSKSYSEEITQASTNLHSILKKCSTTSMDGSGQPRRSSNVGFKDEEPLVIGYGGRDFSPEELDGYLMI